MSSYLLTAAEDVVTVAGPLFERDPAAWKALCRWLEQHGIAPHDVPATCCIMRWPAERRISVDMFTRDEAGRVLLARNELEPERSHRVVQLESPPLPFPPEVFAADTRH